MEIARLGLEGVAEIRPKRLDDKRGFFSETWNADALAQAGIAIEFVQDNHSFSKARGVLRGLHFQTPPFAQDKLVRVIRGRIFDVAVDIRADSPDYGRWVGLEISAERWNQLFVPRGFAHGFVTLEPNTEVIYKVSSRYTPECDRSIRFDDPAIGIEWPVAHDELILSDKDRDAPLLADVETGFAYGKLP